MKMDSPEENIVDAALDAVLKASGSALKNYTMPLALERMRDAMRAALSKAYIDGTDAVHEIYRPKRNNAQR